MDTFKKYTYIASLIAFVLIASLFGVRTQDKTTSNSCLESGCHTMVSRGWFKHVPVKDDCTNCHKMVKANHPEGTGREYELADKVPDLCNGCHDVMGGDKSKHSPAAKGECLGCHDPHSSDLRNLLKTEAGKPICLKCHDVAGKEMNVHGPVKKNECSTCHEPHSSKYNKLLRNEEDKLCLSCHNKPIKASNHTIEDISQKLSSKNVHDPVTSGCTGCHTPHASKNKSLMSSDFNTDIYVYEKGKTGSLCFTCHSDEILLKDKAQSTGFRNGDMNLHFIHVNRDKSRNCMICHDVHGSDGAHLIKSSTRFAKWSLPINYSQIQDGGTCKSGCHDQLSYNIKASFVKSSEPIVEAKDKAQPKDKTQDLSKLSSTIKGQIKVDPAINKSLIQGLGLNLVNIDTTINETLPLDKELKFQRSNLPIGIYNLSLNTDDLDELKAKPDKISFQVDLKDSASVIAANDINFDMKFDEIPTKKIEPIVKNEIINFNQTRTFNYKNEKVAMQTKGLNNYLNSANEFMKANPKARIMIVVHTDNVGSTQELQKISNNIGKNIENYLTKLGINIRRIFSQGKGSLFPVKSSATDKGKAANRRIEIKILKQ